MFRRKTVLTQGLCEEKSVYDSFNKLIAAQIRVSEQQLRWAKTEENPLFLCLFGRLAELSWIGNELIKQLQDKQTELNRVFRDIDQEEKIVDESRKALLACKAKYLKLQKQLEHSRKKNDTAKIQCLEVELTTQGSLRDHLTESVETQSQKLELYKIDLLKKGLQSQAQAYLDITVNWQALFNAQLQLADMLPPEPPSSATPHEERVPDEMKKLLSQLAESLRLHPPSNGGINVKKLSEAGHSPPVLRRSSADELLPKSSRGKSQHSISQPILVGHSHSPPLEDISQVYNFPLKYLPLEEASGEYLGSATSDENKSGQSFAPPGVFRRSPHGLRRTQSGYTSYPRMADQKQRHNTRDVVKPHDPSLSDSHSIPSKESGVSTSSSTEDVNKERGETSCSGSGGSDDCYADPVDAINEFLQGNKLSLSPSEGPNSVELTNSDSALISPSEEPPAQQSSKEQQLHMFHERLFKAYSDGNELPKKSKDCDHSEVDDEPTYSNPFDALAANSRKPFKVTTDKLKRSSPNAWQVQGHPSGRNSPPPPPVPSRDEKKLGQKPFHYARRDIGENMGGSTESSVGSGNVVQVQAAHVWNRKGSNRGRERQPPSPTQRAPGGGVRPQIPVAVSHQQSQSNRVTLDTMCLQSRPPMPLPIPEQHAAEDSGRGQPLHAAHITTNGKHLHIDVHNIKQKALLERSNSDSMNRQQQSMYCARHGMAQVLPLSAREIVQKHMSHVAY